MSVHHNFYLDGKDLGPKQLHSRTLNEQYNDTFDVAKKMCSHLVTWGLMNDTVGIKFLLKWEFIVRLAGVIVIKVSRNEFCAGVVIFF